MTLITALALTGPLRPRYFAPPLRRRTPAGSGPSGSGGLALRPSGPGPWRRPPSEPVIGSSDVHVWRVPIADAGPSDLALLDERERERADRFRFGAHRQQYVAAH